MGVFFIKNEWNQAYISKIYLVKQGISWLIFLMNKYKRLVDEYIYPGFRPSLKVQVYPGKSDARIITLRRRQKKTYAVAVVKHITLFMIESSS